MKTPRKKRQFLENEKKTPKLKTPIFENAQKNVKKKRLRQGGDFFNFGKKITQKTPKKNAQKNASKIKINAQKTP